MKLTEEEIQKYLKDYNPNTGVDAITREELENIDKAEVQKIDFCGDKIKDKNGKTLYTYDYFTPRAGSYAFKPSFAGRQYLLGITDNGDLIFSNGRWFAV